VTRLARRWIPDALLARYRGFKRARDQRRNERQSTEDVFSAIYRKNEWGGEAGALFSGTGSNEQAASGYVGMVTEKATELGFLGLHFVDLGCGDFRIGLRLLPLCSRYTGVDIVKPVVEFNRAHYGSATTRFEQLNIVEDTLPDGDVCFVRQVFQHLSNKQVAAVLPRLSPYRWVFITEHYPPDNDAIRPNVDKAQGGGIRAYDNSGVYLTEPPFTLPADRVTLVLEVAADGSEAGVIRTFLYRPGHNGGVA
jgi:SAM-dependent methyltransferase